MAGCFTPKKYLGGAEGAINVECFPDTQEALGSVPSRAQKVGVASQTWSPSSTQAETDKQEFRVIKDYTGVRGQLGLCKTLSLKNKK